ncbi:MAG: hypothetical protein ACRD0S_02650, partial [Acidimicrobiales bacterium]
MPVIDWVSSFGASGFSLITPGDDPVFDFAGTPVVGFSADRALLRISDAVHISGSFSFRAGPVEYVDVVTGFTGTPTNPTLATALGLIDVSTEADGDDDDTWEDDPGGQTLARSSDYGIIYNLPVRTVQIGASGVSVFVGWAPGLSAWNLGTDTDGVLSRAEFDTLTGDNAGTTAYDGDGIGLFVANLDLGMVLATPTPLPAPLTTLPPQLPRFFAFTSLAEQAGWVGFEDVFQLTARNVAVEANRASTWIGLPLAPTAAIDWIRSYGETGFEVPTGTTTDPVAITFEGTPLIGFSADKLLLQISDAVHISGAFSVRIGPIEYVDVVTGLTGAPSGPLGLALAKISVSSVADVTTDSDDWEEDPGGQTLARSTDYGIIYNVAVRTLQIGASSVSVFLGWAPGLSTWDFDGDTDGILSRSELNALTGDDAATTAYDGDAIGLFVENMRLGLMTMSPVPLTGLLSGVDLFLPRLIGLNSFADSAGWIGFEDVFELTLRNVAVEVNQGSAWAGLLPAAPHPAVDWVRSFGASGFAVRTGSTSAAAPVQLDFAGTPLVGFSADRVLLQISDAVVITGGFSVRVGPVEYVDLVTGLTGAPSANPALAAALVRIPVSSVADVSTDSDSWEEDPGSQILARSSDYGIIYNVPTNTLQFGISGASVFLGWAPGLSAWNLAGDTDGILSRTELNALTGDDAGTSAYDGDAIGLFVENMRLGLMTLSPVPLLGALAGVNLVLPKLFSLNSFAASAGWIGFEDVFELTMQNVAVEVNQGTAWVGLPLTIPRPTVDWARSYPDTDGAGPDQAGFEVRTGTTSAAAPVVLDFVGPLVGFSADKVLLQISDAVVITGGFSVRVGPVEYVDIVTGLTGVPSVNPALAAALALIGVSTEADGDD